MGVRVWDRGESKAHWEVRVGDRGCGIEENQAGAISIHNEDSEGESEHGMRRQNGGGMGPSKMEMAGGELVTKDGAMNDGESGR